MGSGSLYSRLSDGSSSVRGRRTELVCYTTNETKLVFKGTLVQDDIR